MYWYHFNFKVVVESLPAADVLATKDSVNSTISPEIEATAEYINEKPFRPNEKRARVLRIKMSETESEGNFGYVLPGCKFNLNLRSFRYAPNLTRIIKRFSFFSRATFSALTTKRPIRADESVLLSIKLFFLLLLLYCLSFITTSSSVMCFLSTLCCCVLFVVREGVEKRMGLLLLTV